MVRGTYAWSRSRSRGRSISGSKGRSQSQSRENRRKDLKSAREHSSPSRRRRSQSRRNKGNRQSRSRARRRSHSSSRRKCSRSRSRSCKRTRSRSRSRSRSRRRGRSRGRRRKGFSEEAPEVYFLDASPRASPENEARRLSDGNSSTARDVRAELARRWGDISVTQQNRVQRGGRGDVTGRLLQQSIQTRANLIQRKALGNLIGRSLRASIDASIGIAAASPNTSCPASTATPSSSSSSQHFTPSSEEPTSAMPAQGDCSNTGITGATDPTSASNGSSHSAGSFGTAVSDGSTLVLGKASSLSLPMPSLPAGLSSAGYFKAPAPAPPPAPPPANAAAAAVRVFPVVWPGGIRPKAAERRNFGTQSYLRFWDPDDDGHRLPSDAPESRQEAQRSQKEQDERLKKAEAALSAIPPEHLRDTTGIIDPCSVCQEPMLRGESIRRLPCAHIFHSACIARWLRVRLTCPLDNLALDEMLTSAADRAVTMAATIDVPDSPAPVSPASSPLYQPSLSPSSPRRPPSPPPLPPSTAEVPARTYVEQPLLLVE
eukprot:TRINITY_DN5009_c0_g1_i1.p1 TRINITY_DN5009_c0_g1~~TRINITY_DN5009_c0_g1_i1.p1  ORF type:complete len:544 (-),score=66.04 TRINITY_DN5009_c0_g1_i1:31-1662(-)